MKKRIAMTIALLMAMVNYIVAENSVSIADFSLSAGETKQVSVLLDNDVQYVAFQFDLYLPEGVSLIEYEMNSGRVPESTEVSMEAQKNGCYRFLAAAMSMEPIVGSEGGIITLKLKADADITFGSHTGYLQGVKLSKEDGTGVTISEVPFTVKVWEPSTVTARSYTRGYGEENPTFEYDVEGGELEGTPDISSEATVTSPVGTYPIVITKGTVMNENDSYVNGTLTVTKAPLTITAKSYAIRQGEPLPTFEVEYSGFKNGETEETLAKKPTITCNATSGDEFGTYDIIVSGAEAENYDIEYVMGTLVIDIIVPMEEDVEVAFEESITEETDLTSTVIENVYVTLDTEGDDGYDVEEKCIVLASTVTDEQLEVIADKEVKNETVKENYNGLIFKVSAGKGTVSITMKTKGNRTLNVKIGDAEAQAFVQVERGEVTIPYNVEKDTHVYIYGADASAYAKRRASGENTDNGVLIYGIKCTQEIMGDANQDGEVDVADIIAIANHILGSTPSTFSSAAADMNGDGEIDVADIIAIANHILGNGSNAKSRGETEVEPQ